MLWWIVGVLAVFGLSMLATRDAAAGDALRAAVVLGVTVGVVSWLGYRYRVLPRRASFAAQARELGLDPQPGDPLGLLDGRFALFRRAASMREIENTARGVRDHLDVTVADYWYAASSDPSRDDYERFTCVVTSVPREWPDVAVVPERLASRLAAWAVPDIATESEEFNRRFEVRSPDRRFALALLDQRMLQWLLEQLPGVGFEILDGRLMVFCPRLVTSLDDVAKALDTFAALRRRIPRVVGPITRAIPPPPVGTL